MVIRLLDDRTYSSRSLCNERRWTPFCVLPNKKAHQLVGSAKRDVTHTTATVVFNAGYHLFRKRVCIAVHRLAWAIDRDNNTIPAVYVMHRSI